MALQNQFVAQTPIGAALQNLSQLFAPVAAGRVEFPSEFAARQAGTRKTNVETNALLAERTGYGNIANRLAAADLQGRNFAPSGPHPRQAAFANQAVSSENSLPQYRGNQAQSAMSDALISAIRAGIGGDDIGKINRQFVGVNNLGDDAAIRANAALGSTIGVNSAVSGPGQDAIAARNSLAAMAEKAAEQAGKPRTKSEVEGGILARLIPTLTDAQKKTAVGILGTPSLKNFQSVNGGTGRLDQNNPEALFQAIPTVVQGDGGVTLGQAELLGEPGTTGTSSNPTASQKNLESTAATMGISLQQLQFKLQIEARSRALAFGGRGIKKLTREDEDTYNAIQNQITGNVNSQPLPPGFVENQVVQ